MTARLKSQRTILLTPLFCLLFIPILQAQAYKVGVGWRFGTSVSGINVKIAPVRKLAFEGIVGLFPNGTTGTILVERYQPILGRFLQIYGGAGAHARFNYRREGVTGKLAFQLPLEIDHKMPIGVGVDVIAGLELKIPAVPIFLNAEIKPYVELTPVGNLDFALDPAIGAKMTFGKWKRKRKRRGRGLFRDNDGDRDFFRKKEERNRRDKRQGKNREARFG